MLDLRLRSTKERLLRPIASWCAGRISPASLTVTSAILCIGAGAAAWRHLTVIAVAAWLVGRALDGLDGALARSERSASDIGGYADLLLDSVGYAAVPLGIAMGAADLATWQVVAVLIATFYVNSVSWLMLTALLEKQNDTNAGADTHRDGYTSVTMPTALVEGTETIVIFTIALAVPSMARTLFVVMAVGVVVSIVQRAIAAHRLLRN